MRCCCSKSVSGVVNSGVRTPIFAGRLAGTRLRSTILAAALKLAHKRQVIKANSSQLVLICGSTVIQLG